MKWINNSTYNLFYIIDIRAIFMLPEVNSLPEGSTQYANNVHSQRIHILEAESGKKGYFCPGCGGEKVAIRPTVLNIKPHFRHTAEGMKKHKQANCTYSDESTRHKIAKDVLQIIKKIKVPPVYFSKDGAKYLIESSKFIEASSVRNEVYIFEDSNGKIILGNKQLAVDNNKFFLIKADVVFFDQENNPIIIIEIYASNKVDEDKKAKLFRLGINAVEVSIPKHFDPQLINDNFLKIDNTEWIYNTHYDKFYDKTFTSELEKRYSSSPEQPSGVPFNSETFECRKNRLGNAIRLLERFMESSEFIERRGNLKAEISRTESIKEKIGRDIELAQERFQELDGRARGEAKGRILQDFEKRRVRHERSFATIKDKERELRERFKTEEEDLEGRYNKKAGELISDEDRVRKKLDQIKRIRKYIEARFFRDKGELQTREGRFREELQREEDSLAGEIRDIEEAISRNESCFFGEETAIRKEEAGVRCQEGAIRPSSEKSKEELLDAQRSVEGIQISIQEADGEITRIRESTKRLQSLSNKLSEAADKARRQ